MAHGGRAKSGTASIRAFRGAEQAIARRRGPWRWRRGHRPERLEGRRQRSRRLGQGAMEGGAGRLRAFSSENWPEVKPTGAGPRRTGGQRGPRVGHAGTGRYRAPEGRLERNVAAV